jgi:hypothetical protein
MSRGPPLVPQVLARRLDHAGELGCYARAMLWGCSRSRFPLSTQLTRSCSFSLRRVCLSAGQEPGSSPWHCTRPPCSRCACGSACSRSLAAMGSATRCSTRRLALASPRTAQRRARLPNLLERGGGTTTDPSCLGAGARSTRSRWAPRVCFGAMSCSAPLRVGFTGRVGARPWRRRASRAV